MGKGSGLFEINLVSVSMVLALLGLGYAGWKFIPPLYQAQEVNQVLDGARAEAAKINMFEDDPRAQKLLNRVLDDCVELGVDERTLDVYFSEGFESVNADYSVIIDHLGLASTTLEFERSAEIPRSQMTD